ncbi:MAG: DUF721 domain-containing protein [Deltaproteobacteria bacterium]|nr:DUF721 domain-containing protein [Deltaproteobacteria bacterium]
MTTRGKTPRRGPPRLRTATRAGVVVSSVLASYGLDSEIRGQRLITEWTELVGPRIAARTRPDGISERTLWIEVATSAWLHELNMLRPQLVRGLYERLGDPRLFDDVKFKLAGRSKRPPPTVPTARRPPPPFKPAPLPATGAKREQIAREVAKVDDVELRELIARVRITHDK